MARTRGALAILLTAGLTIAGCAVSATPSPESVRSVARAPTPSRNPPSVPTPATTGSPRPTVSQSPAASGQGGVRGTTVVNPCPVVREPLCPPRPVAARVTITDTGTAVAAVVSSGSDGRFSVTLRPGSYELRAVATSGLARPTSPIKVLVRANQFTVVTIYIDIGIR